MEIVSPVIQFWSDVTTFWGIIPSVCKDVLASALKVTAGLTVVFMLVSRFIDEI